MSRLEPLLVEGIGAAAGRAYGEGARHLVRAHRDMVIDHLHRSVDALDLQDVHRCIDAHRSITTAVLPEIAAEVDGVGEGAGIGTTDAWLLQMRAEVERAVGLGHAPECSAFAVLPPRSRTGHVLAAQNVDLPPRYASVLTAVRRRLCADTAFLTVTPAGQLAHHGLNTHGVAVFANFIHTRGWRAGMPRYLLSRLALAASTCDAAVQAVSSPPRAASRALLLADPHSAACLELTPTTVGHGAADLGYLAHTNHVTGDLHAEDVAGAAWLRNSHARLARLRTLLDGRELGVVEIQQVLRDRSGAPDALCHRTQDDAAIDYATVCSSIADTAARVLWVAPGDPSAGTPYTPHRVEAGNDEASRSARMRQGASGVPTA